MNWLLMVDILLNWDRQGILVSDEQKRLDRRVQSKTVYRKLKG